MTDLYRIPDAFPIEVLEKCLAVDSGMAPRARPQSFNRIGNDPRDLEFSYHQACWASDINDHNIDLFPEYCATKLEPLFALEYGLRER